MWFPPYFYSRFGCRRLWGVVNRRFGTTVTSNGRTFLCYGKSSYPVCNVGIFLPNGCMYSSGYEGRLRRRRHYVRWRPSSPEERGTAQTAASPTFRPMSIVAKRSPISSTAEFLYKRPPQNTWHYAMGPLYVVYLTLMYRPIVAKWLNGSRCHLVEGRPRPRPHCVR